MGNVGRDVNCSQQVIGSGADPAAPPPRKTAAQGHRQHRRRQVRRAVMDGGAGKQSKATYRRHCRPGHRQHRRHREGDGIAYGVVGHRCSGGKKRNYAAVGFARYTRVLTNKSRQQNKNQLPSKLSLRPIFCINMYNFLASIFLAPG